MTENVDVPKMGKVPKPALIAIGVGLAAFVGWRYWQSRSGSGEDVPADVSDFDYEGTVPPVLGAVSPDNRYGSGGDTGRTDDDGILGPGEFTNNGQWTDYVVGKLTSSETWSYSDIVTAIGNGLAGRPTNDTQQNILRAAVAVGGQPPQGQITIVSGGNTAPATAPGNLRAASVTADSVTLSWDAVAGADTYRVSQSNGLSKSVSGTSTQMTGLNHATQYTFTVAAVNGSGSTAGPTSTVTATTSAKTIGAPAKPSLSNIGRTSVSARTTKPAGADELIWYLNGREAATTEGGLYVFKALKPGTRYTITAAGDTARQAIGPVSPGATFTTKK